MLPPPPSHPNSYGASVYAFPDWMTAHNFRAKVYAAEGLTMPTAPPLSVTILDRKSFKPRHIENQKEVRGLVTCV